MNKFAIAILVSAGSLLSTQAVAQDRAVVGAVEGALVGAHFGGAHGAVAGAILGAAIGGASESRYDRGYREPVHYARDVERYAPAPVYYAPPVSYRSYREPRYETYYEPRYETYYEPRRIAYVQPRVYDVYPVYYPAPVYVSHYGRLGRDYSHHSRRHGRDDYRRRY